MKITVKRQMHILIALASAVCVVTITGCQSHSSTSSVEDYKKAAAGSALPPAQQAAMIAGINKAKADAEARQAAHPMPRPNIPGAH